MANIERYRAILEVHLIMLRDDHILMMRRKNTGYEDGSYGLVAGHVEDGESAVGALIREANEEVGIALHLSDLHLVHVMHRKGADGPRLALFFMTRTWSGEPVNKEIHLCDDLRWVHLDRLPCKVIPYVRRAVGHAFHGIRYDELGWRR